LLHADYCAEYEYTSKILLSRGKKLVPLYTVEIYTKKKIEKGSSNEDVVCSVEEVLLKTCAEKMHKIQTTSLLNLRNPSAVYMP
jgi:hypothetical protein